MQREKRNLPESQNKLGTDYKIQPQTNKKVKTIIQLTNLYHNLTQFQLNFPKSFYKPPKSHPNSKHNIVPIVTWNFDNFCLFPFRTHRAAFAICQLQERRLANLLWPVAAAADGEEKRGGWQECLSPGAWM